MGKTRPIHKNCFQLLEVLISLFLIVTCLVPLLLPNVNLYKIEKRRMAACKAYSLDRELLCKAKCALFEKKYSWEQLQKGKSEEDYQIKFVNKTERTALNKEGLLVEVITPFNKHLLFVERS